VNALRTLLNERMFVTLLREESMPKASVAFAATHYSEGKLMGWRTVKLAFERDTMVLPLDSMLPLKELPESIRRSHRYRRMSSSIEEVGVIEPLAVFYRPDGKAISAPRWTQETEDPPG